MKGVVEGGTGWARDKDGDFGWRSCILWFGVECGCLEEFHSSNVYVSMMKSWNVVGGGDLVFLLGNQ